MTERTSHDSHYDLILQLLLGIAETVDAIPMTLNVGGLIISGELISEPKFKEEFMYGHLWKRVVEVINEEESLKAEIQQSAQNEDAETKVHRFIHLRNARYFFPGQNPMPANDGALWRGRVDAVDGYLFGKFETKRPD